MIRQFILIGNILKDDILKNFFINVYKGVEYMEDKDNINLDNEKITDKINNGMKDSDAIHINKTKDDGKEVDIDINKNKKMVNVSVNKEKDGKKQM